MKKIVLAPLILLLFTAPVMAELVPGFSHGWEQYKRHAAEPYGKSPDANYKASRNNFSVRSEQGVYADLRLSSEKVKYGSNYNQVCVAEYGSNWQLADWKDLELYYKRGGDLNVLAKKTGFDSKVHGWVTCDGDPDWSNTRDYFASFHNHKKPSSYLAHKNLDNYNFSLGSWYGTKYVLCRRASNK